MNSALKWAIKFALFLTAVVVFTVGRPDAASAQVDVPVDVCGVGVGVLGNSSADCGGVPATPAGDSATPTASVGSDGVGSGGSSGLVGGVLDQVVGDVDVDADVDAAAPVDVCGVGVGVLGDTSSNCTEPAPEVVPVDNGPIPSSAPPEATPADDGSLVGDIDVDADVDAAVPVDVCGVGVGVLGEASADCGGDEAAAPSSSGSSPTVTAEPGVGSEDGSADGSGLVGDTEAGVDADAGVPVGVCGIGVGVLGDTSSNCVSGNSVVAAPPATPADPTPSTPVVPAVPSDPTGPLNDLPVGGTTGLVDRVLNPLTEDPASQLTSLRRLLDLGSSSTGLLGDGVPSPASALAATGSSTQLLLWLQGALIGAGTLLRSLAKALGAA